jgi:hypothetical protein
MSDADRQASRGDRMDRRSPRRHRTLLGLVMSGEFFSGRPDWEVGAVRGRHRTVGAPQVWMLNGAHTVALLGGLAMRSSLATPTSSCWRPSGCGTKMPACPTSVWSITVPLLDDSATPDRAPPRPDQHGFADEGGFALPAPRARSRAPASAARQSLLHGSCRSAGCSLLPADGPRPRVAGLVGCSTRTCADRLLLRGRRAVAALADSLH